MLLSQAFVLLAMVAAGLLAVSAAQPGRATRRQHCPKPVGQAIRAGEIVPTFRRLVARNYGDMTNQSGGGAWRGYQILGEFALAGPMRLAHSYYAKAARACGREIANRSWVAIISFPRAQSAVYGTSAAYLARIKHGIVIWRSQFVQP